MEQRSDAAPGHLLFFNDGNCGRVSSAAIVISKNEVVRASGTAGRVIRARLHWPSVVGIARPSPASPSLRDAERNTSAAPGTVRPKGCDSDDPATPAAPLDDSSD